MDLINQAIDLVFYCKHQFESFFNITLYQQVTIIELIQLFTYLVVAAIISRDVFKLCKGIWTCWVANWLGFGYRWSPGKNRFAIVTGATDGIGLAYAKQLAGMGYSMVLVSRDVNKLRSVANQLCRDYKNCNEVRIVAADFTRSDIYKTIAEEINTLPNVDVLVNNVGRVYEKTELFHKIPSNVNDDYVNINIVSYLKMTELVLPKMVKQQRGVVINVSALTAMFPCPMYSTYGATKVFQDRLAQSLALEYRSHGIVFQSVRPSFVRTKLIPEHLPVYFALSPDTVAAAAIKTVGLETNTSGHWMHKLLKFGLDELNLVGCKWIFEEIVFWWIKRGKKTQDNSDQFGA